MINEAIILAGGFGTRLKHVVKELPKSMASINNKPFLEYLLLYLKGQGIRSVILSVGYKYEQIQDYFGDSFNGIEIIYAIEDEPLGTGGGILNAMKYIRGESAFVLNGDTFFDVDLSKFFDFCMKNETDIGLVLKHVDDLSRYGSVAVDKNNRIIEFREKETLSGSGYINGGIYYLSKDLYSQQGKTTKFSIEKDFFEQGVNKFRIFGFLSDDYFIDIGIPEAFYRAQDEFKRFKY